MNGMILSDFFADTWRCPMKYSTQKVIHIENKIKEKNKEWQQTYAFILITNKLPNVHETEVMTRNYART